MLNNFFILFFSYFLIVFSVLGYGFIFENFFYKKSIKSNIGYSGLRGLFILIIYSFFSHLFYPHSMLHNSIIFTLGLFFFILFFKKKIIKKDFLIFNLILALLFIGLLIFKTHDDFPFYHFPYSYYLTQNPIHIGIGLFNSGFKTPSSLFYLNSLFYLPLIKYYSFYITTVLFLSFANFILINKIFKHLKKNQIDYIFFLNLLFFVFINIFFYRIQEHGTDRSAQILILILFLQLLLFINFKKDQFARLDIIIILTGIIVSLKSFYVLYLILTIPLIYILFKNNKFDLIYYIFKNKIFYLFNFLILLIILTYFLNSGCLIYPVYQTCFDNLSWSTGIDEVKKMNIWYQQWSKGGATPNFRVENPEEYIRGINWVENWINVYFFNKVSDYLLGLIAVCVIFTFFFYNKSRKIKINKDTYIIYSFISILFLEWFYNHPTLRYGGYNLIVILIFFPLSIFLSTFKYDLKKNYLKTIIIISITIIIFTSRNFNRINDEMNKYNYKPFKETFYKLEATNFRIEDKFLILIKNYNECIKNKINCKNDLDPKVKRLFNNSYMFFHE